MIESIDVVDRSGKFMKRYLRSNEPINNATQIRNMDSEREIGAIVQYVGPTTYAYTEGYFYMWDGKMWNMISVLEDKKSSNDISSSTKCKICGAPLVLSKARNGICKCEWCRSENYV